MKQEKQWKLGQYVIFECEKGYGWVTWHEYDGEISRFTGHGKIDNKSNVLLLSSWRAQNEETQTLEELNDYFNKLPRWSKTSRVSKSVDIGSPVVFNVNEIGSDQNDI